MNQFKHAKWWRSYLDKLWQSFWKLKFMKNQALELHSPLPKSFKVCKERTKEKSKENQREAKRSKEENRGQQLQSSLTLLEHFPKSIFCILYTISKLRKSKIQRFKPCTIWSWNEEDMAFERKLLQACAKLAHPLSCANGVRNSHTPSAVWTVCKTRTPFAHPMRGANFPLFLPTPHEIFYFGYFCINFHSSPCNPPIIRFIS